MKLIFTYALTLAAGVGASYIAASFAGMWFPHLFTPVFLGLALIWAFLGWKHASLGDRNAAPYRTSDMSESDVAGIRPAIRKDLVTPPQPPDVLASASADPITAFVRVLLPDFVFMLRDFADTVHRLLSLGSEEPPASSTGPQSVFRHSVLFALHVLDRRAFRTLGPFKRRVFMDAVLEGVADDPATTGWRVEDIRSDWNASQQVFSRYSAFFPDAGTPPNGTLFWEFGKSAASKAGEANPIRILAVAAGTKYLVEVCDTLCEGALHAAQA
jgi:hypothetical protein